jgi:hypothetical protein
MVGLTDREELVELLARYASSPDARDYDVLPGAVFTDRVMCDFESAGAGPHNWDGLRWRGSGWLAAEFIPTGPLA